MIFDFLKKKEREVLYFVVTVYKVPQRLADGSETYDVHTDYFKTWPEAKSYADGIRNDFGLDIQEQKIFRSVEAQ